MTIEQFKKAERLLLYLEVTNRQLAHMEDGKGLAMVLIPSGAIKGYPINRDDVLQFLQSRKESIEKELEAL